VPSSANPTAASPANAPGGRRGLTIALGLLTSALFLFLAGWRLDWVEIRAGFASARPFPGVLVAAGCYVVGHWVRGFRCRALVSQYSLMSLPTATSVVVVGYAANNLLPMRGGELVRAGMLAERTGVGASQALTVTFLERVLDGLTIIALLLVSLAVVPASPLIDEILRVGLIVFGAATGLIAIAVLVPAPLVRFGTRFGLARFALGVTNGVAYLRQPRGLLLAVVTSALVWVLEAAMFYFVLPTVGLDAHVSWAVLAMAVTNLGILVPSSPGFIGPFHFFCAQALLLVGVAAETAFGYAAIVHLVFYIPITLWGVGVIVWYGTSLGRAAALARAAKTPRPIEALEGVPVVRVGSALDAHISAPTRPLTRSLVEAALPEGAHVTDADVAQVSHFVQQQLDALPPHLRFLYGLGLIAFRSLVALRFLRDYTALSAARRRSVFAAWAYGRFAIGRKLFRAVRSIALLAYYDLDKQPEVGRG